LASKENDTNVSQPAVLVISETPGFSQTILDLWHIDSNLPSPTAMSSDLCGNLSSGSFDLAIVEGLSASRLEALLRQLEPHGKTLLILVSGAPDAEVVRGVAPRALVLQQGECSTQTLMLVASEVVKRIQAVGNLRLAEEALAVNESSAMLGRYITEMRHTINNALTSVMGNSELMLFEPGGFSAHHRSQIETIRTMSVRIHEIMQRMASLETEMKWMEKQKDHDQQRKLATAAG
jgi:signal transduction histidine kinase